MTSSGPSLSELFSIDPEALTEEQCVAIVDALRAQRMIWAKGVAEAKSTGKRPTGRMPKAKGTGEKPTSIFDLGNIVIE